MGYSFGWAKNVGGLQSIVLFLVNPHMVVVWFHAAGARSRRLKPSGKHMLVEFLSTGPSLL